MSVSTPQSDPSGRHVDVNTLNWEQLNQVHQSLQADIQNITTSYGSLRLAVGRFKTSQECLKDISNDNKDKDILVPLTSSLYIPGKLKDINKVIVEVGDKFYVEKDIKDAKDFLGRKVDDLEKRVKTVGDVLSRKNQDIQVVNMVRRARAQEALKAQAKANKG
mmetsp:Transcript_14806/g.20610  ORF Transcript_14806/g.20610 Transcript_14806/m.20610 type:complete len:163 (+) Transcript_14806:50-538(+)|eukprot:CAMPEP_0185265280 /NCGR_PEP_ID=MMETSP1359-20130426/27013_1 /TAXON_ID=552665 /ORGANISM="Bigelowiella longifila, Strain CCMP242" /LENGTH=162 /DNA_ID=CAMNT_0027854469 /DNA_START=11 /DNA_END=499 /DNA_ORIENTATION=-